MWRKSKMDTLDPKRAKPRTASVLLARTKFRRESELPICTKSNTDKEEPNRARPSRVKVLLKRANCRSDMELPR
jgi:hypothetical protein